MANDFQRDVAGRFFQAMGTQTFEVFGRLYPDRIGFVEDYTRRKVENEGLLREGVDILLRWFRSDDDARWLEEFRNSEQGKRFLEVTIELFATSMLRQFGPLVNDQALIRGLLIEGLGDPERWPAELSKGWENPGPLARLIHAYEAILTEMRMHGSADRLLESWVTRLDQARDEFLESTAEKEENLP